MLHLREAQVVALDAVTHAIRKTTGVRGVNRSAVVRGILDAVRVAGPDLSGCASEEDVRKAIVAALRPR